MMSCMQGSNYLFFLIIIIMLISSLSNPSLSHYVSMLFIYVWKKERKIIIMYVYRKRDRGNAELTDLCPQCTHMMMMIHEEKKS